MKADNDRDGYTKAKVIGFYVNCVYLLLLWYDMVKMIIPTYHTMVVELKKNKQLPSNASCRSLQLYLHGAYLHYNVNTRAVWPLKLLQFLVRGTAISNHSRFDPTKSEMYIGLIHSVTCLCPKEFSSDQSMSTWITTACVSLPSSKLQTMQ